MVTKPIIARLSSPTPASVPRNHVPPEATRSHQHRFAGRQRNTAAPAPTNTNPAIRSSRATSHDRPTARRPPSAYTPTPTATAQAPVATRVEAQADGVTRGAGTGRARGAASGARAVIGPAWGLRPPRPRGLSLDASPG